MANLRQPHKNIPMKCTCLYSRLFLFLICLMAANSAFPETSDSTVVLQLGDPALSHFGDSGSTHQRQEGLIFYQKEFQQGSHGTVEFIHGTHHVLVENVLSAVGDEDVGMPPEITMQSGITEWSINFGATDQEADLPIVGRDRLMQFFAALRAGGWKRFVDISDPRLAGKEAWQYSDGAYYLDPTYTPTLDEWKASLIKMPKWVFYADGVYLKIYVQVWPAGIAGKQVYLFSLDIQNEYEFYGVRFFHGKDREGMRNWKALLPAKLEEYHAMRLKTEAKLKAQGYTIDTTYQDPPIKALESAPRSPGN